MPRRRFGDNLWRILLENPDLKRWHTNVSQGSQVTADVYLRRFGAVSDRMGIPILDMPKMKEKDVHTMLLDFIAREQAAGRPGPRFTAPSRRSNRGCSTTESRSTSP